MIISRTPFRISFFGGGTDYPAWYHEHGGAVLGTTIDKYCYISCRYLPPFFDHHSQVVYSKVETVKSNAQIEHRAVRGALRFMEIDEGVDIHYVGDLPARTGLGSSSSFTVGLLHALFALKRTMPTKSELAATAIHVEQEVLKEHVGCQDQVLASCGGFVRVDFPVQPKGYEFHLTPVIVGRERLEQLQDHLLLYFTGISRIASEIAKEQLTRMGHHRRELSMMQRMVGQAVALVTGTRPLSEFGELLHESWMLKRSLSPRISSSAIDEIYAQARQAGAIGGKILGAGGGGFMLLFARPDDHPAIQARLRGLLRVPFRFEQSGSRIILYEPGEAREWERQPLRETVEPRAKLAAQPA